MDKIVIVGAGGFAKEVAFLIEEINRKQEKWKIMGFVADEVGGNNGKYQIVGNDDWLLNVKEKISVVFAIGNPNTLKKVIEKIKQNENLIFPNIVHPNVVADWERIEMGIGNIFCAGTILTTDIFFGSFNILNLDCTIGHDTKVGSFNVFNPSVNISGGIEMGSEILLGTGSQILQYNKIVSNVVIGAGSVVTKDITEKGVYVGVPAKKIK